ncbi:MAG: hypothetical protein EA382_16430 [Spirochaetaceae bacterium]|nr:MAG: hypothetical protein EA382_16430 [Spirochaetaceae bacterium]
MEDYRENVSRKRSQIRRNIESLQGKMKSARNPFQQSSIAGEIGKLEQEQMQLSSLFDEGGETDQDDSTDVNASDDAYPVLNRIHTEHEQILRKSGHLERDVRAAILYLHEFEQEYLGIFTSRKLRLDVKYSVERDSFYDLFHQLSRSLKNYRIEADRIAEGSYTKQYETDILKRKVEMRHALLVEVDWFFRKLRRFARELINDIAGDAVLCQNPNESLDYSTLDRERQLRDKTVAEAVQMLLELAAEAVSYVDIPDFQQRPL